MAISFMNSSMLNIGQSSLQIMNKSKKQHIYGIKRLRSASDSTWERTDDSIGLVANATHDGTSVQNDFDSLSPWKDIISFNYNHSLGKITAYYGDDNFNFSPTDSNINVFTRIPKFWYRRWVDEDDYEHIQIANYETAGFLESEEFAVGRYTTQGSTSAPRIISGNAPLLKIGSTSYRNSAKSMNNNIYLLDWKTLGAIQLLYLVEYANYDSQSILGYGNCNGSVVNSGQLDNLGMKSGCLNNDKSHSVIYRGIEDIFGNVCQLIDGINFDGIEGYICNDYKKYSFGTFDGNYVQIPYSAPGGENIKKHIMNENYPLLLLPEETGNNGCIPDYFHSAPTYTETVMRIGGYNSDGLSAGIFCITINYDSGGISFGGSRFILRQNI